MSAGAKPATQPRRSPKYRCPGLPDSCVDAGYAVYCSTCVPGKRHRCGVRITAEQKSSDGRCVDCYVLTK